MGNLKSNTKRAKNAIVLIWIILALEILMLISSYWQYNILQTLNNGGNVSEETIQLSDSIEGIIGLFYMIGFIISTITFIQWFRRAYFNLHLIVGNLSYSEAWASGSWFVPILNLFRPYRIMKELYVETRLLLVRNRINFNQNLYTDNLGWWWTIWIVSNWVENVVFKSSLKAETINELITSSVFSMISNILGILLALITIKVIRNYAKVEPLLNQIKSNVVLNNDIINLKKVQN